MKKLLFSCILSIVLMVFLVSCSDSSNYAVNQSETLINESHNAKADGFKSDDAKEEASIKPSDSPVPKIETKTNNTEALTDIPPLTISDLFESVYVPYANREKSFDFAEVKSFVKSCDYKADIKVPTRDDVGSIKVNDANGDYVFFSFNTVNGIESIITVSFYQASNNAEVSLGNYSSDGSAEYDNLSIHIIGEQEKAVSSLDEQKSFLLQ